jgi:hypothetical protein
MEDSNLWVRILTIVGSAMTVVVGFLMTHIFRQHTGVFKDVADIKTKHAEFQLFVSENYAKKTDLNAARLETNNSLERIHQRLDNILEVVKK